MQYINANIMKNKNTMVKFNNKKCTEKQSTTEKPKSTN